MTRTAAWGAANALRCARRISDLSGVRVGEIARKTHLTRPSVSHHLQILKETGIVAMREEGTMNYYYLSVDETRWKEIYQLIALIYESVRHISAQPSEGG